MEGSLGRKEDIKGSQVKIIIDYIRLWMTWIGKTGFVGQDANRRGAVPHP
jgi:hypothetical protein